jgi:hypothetical protein
LRGRTRCRRGVATEVDAVRFQHLGGVRRLGSEQFLRARHRSLRRSRGQPDRGRRLLGSICCVAQHGSGRVRFAGVASLIVVTALCVASVNAAAGRPAIASKACHAPQLHGLTFEVALQKATKAGCELRLKGAALERPEVQTIDRQSFPASRASSKVTVWLNPFCRGSAAYGPGIAEPTVTPGRTELVSGFYIVGGPAARFSAPNCKRPAPPPGAGVVEVINATGALVATQRSTAGHLVKIRLPVGSYTVRGTFLNAIVDGDHPRKTQSLTVPVGHTVRQDFFLSVP